MTQRPPIEYAPLIYYHKYEMNHGKAINPKVPLQQHYANEKALRQKADHIEDEIKKNEHQLGFKVREMKHKILGLLNAENKAKAERRAINKVSDQREQSIKEEINHDEKFRELYADRLQTNMKRLKGALPDQRPAYQELVKFDQDRVKHWTETENKYQSKLQQTLGRDTEDRIRIEKLVAGLQAEILSLHAQIGDLKSRVSFKNARLQNELHNIEGTIQQDIALDKQRQFNEKLEARRAAAAQLEKDELTNKNLLQKSE